MWRHFSSVASIWFLSLLSGNTTSSKITPKLTIPSCYSDLKRAAYVYNKLTSISVLQPYRSIDLLDNTNPYSYLLKARNADISRKLNDQLHDISTNYIR